MKHLEQLKRQPVGDHAVVSGHPVIRWEESSPFTRIVADGRPEGMVVIPEEWLVQTGVGDPQSALRRAASMWPNRAWESDWDVVRRTLRLRWTTPSEDSPGRGLQHVTGYE